MGGFLFKVDRVGFACTFQLLETPPPRPPPPVCFYQPLQLVTCDWRLVPTLTPNPPSKTYGTKSCHYPLFDARNTRAMVSVNARRVQWEEVLLFAFGYWRSSLISPSLNNDIRNGNNGVNSNWGWVSFSKMLKTDWNQQSSNWLPATFTLWSGHP